MEMRNKTQAVGSVSPLLTVHIMKTKGLMFLSCDAFSNNP